MFDKELLISVFWPAFIVGVLFYLWVLVKFCQFVIGRSKATGESKWVVAKTSLAVMVRGYKNVFPKGEK